MSYIDTIELLPCKKCGSVGELKSTTNGNVAILCTNKECKNSTRGERGFKCSERMAADDWNERNDPTPKKRTKTVKPIEYMDNDFLGNKINIGDTVIFEAPQYRSFTIGKVVTKAEKSCQIEYINDWNYPSNGRKEVVRQCYSQIIKHPAEILKEFLVKLNDKAHYSEDLNEMAVLCCDIDSIVKKMMERKM